MKIIEVQTCQGCGRLIFVHPVANLTVRLDSEPIDADRATAALVAGRGLWRVTPTSCTGARPAELTALRQRGVLEGPRIHQEHRCAPAGRPGTPSPALGSNDSPKGPEKPAQSLAGPSTPSSAPRTAPSGARGAVLRRSERLASVGEGPVCDGCRKPLQQGTYASVEIGELTVWAHHVLTCE